jgi:ATP-dependent DNA helicase RecG
LKEHEEHQPVSHAYTFDVKTISRSGKRAMTYSFLGPDPLELQLDEVLRQLAAGAEPRNIERPQIDVKEEPGRRTGTGPVKSGSTHNEQAAAFLAEEMACFANTPGGGAIILGISDRGDHIGTNLDPGWLRHRVFELTNSTLTVAVRAVDLEGTRLLVLSTHEAIEPIRYRGRVKWRVDDHCVDIDSTSWNTHQLQRRGADWSAQASGHSFSNVAASAVEAARRFLREAGDEAARDLEASTQEDLLRRLHVVDGGGRLTNAGSLLFVETPGFGIDYIRREVPGGDSAARVRSKRPLIEQIAEVDQLAASLNRAVHVGEGFARGQFRALPPRAIREAIINGVVHRDWLSPEPTLVEHIADTLTVTSPGGFIGGVNPSNIITHPSVPRYRSLAEAIATLRLSEREGIGVDRMVADMLALGRRAPEISTVEGPYVRIGLLGGTPDLRITRLLDIIEPHALASDLDALLLITALCDVGWTDVTQAGPILQRPPRETTGAIERLGAGRVNDRPVLAALAGVPTDHDVAWRLSDPVRQLLQGRSPDLGSPDERRRVVLSWAQARSRVSSTEVADLVDVSVVTAGRLLSQLATTGALRAGRETTGRGFFYVYTNDLHGGVADDVASESVGQLPLDL